MTKNAWNTTFPTANGQLLIARASGSPVWATLSQGTDTTITNGAGSISFAFASGSGDFVFISSATASSSSEITFTGLSSTYDTYMVLMDNVQPATDSVSLYLRTSTNNGSSYDSGASDYSYSYIDINTTEDPRGSTGTTQIALAGLSTNEELGNNTNEKLSGQLFLMKPSAAQYSKITFHGNYHDKSGQQNLIWCGGARKSAADVDAIRFFMSSGNISTGTFKLYGMVAT